MKALKITCIAIVGMFMMTSSSFAQEAKPVVKQPITTTPAPQKPSAPVAWTATTFDFKDIKQGVPVTHDFTFKNTTKQTVLITSVRASCGCTATDYTKTPVKPGETAYVKATYNAASPGQFSKTVTVTLNENEAPVILTIKGKVTPTQS